MLHMLSLSLKQKPWFKEVQGSQDKIAIAQLFIISYRIHVCYIYHILPLLTFAIKKSTIHVAEYTHKTRVAHKGFTV